MSIQAKRILRWTVVLGLIVALLGVGVGRARAVEIVRNGLVAAGQTIDDDAVITGEIVQMDGTINGTLVAAANLVTVDGIVKSDAVLGGQSVIVGEKAVIEGNLFVAGANVVVHGKVNGTIFGGAAALTLGEKASVGRNLLFGGYALEVKPESKIERDVYASGYQVILSGAVRNVEVGAAAVEVRGTVNGNVTLDVPNSKGEVTDIMGYWRSVMPELPPAVAPGLRIFESAKISGKLTYISASEQADAIQSTPGGGVVYQTPIPSQTGGRIEPPGLISRRFFGGEDFWLWGMLRNLVTILILGGLALWLAPRILQKVATQMQERSLASLATGLLLLVVALVAIPVICIALIALGALIGATSLGDISVIIFGVGFAALALAVVVFFTLFLWGGKLTLALISGVWVLKRVAPQSPVHPLGALALGAVILAALAAIPVAGFFFTFLVCLAGVGALWYAWRK